jgi:transcriptional repressor NrdR
VRCPSCMHEESKVIDSRSTQENAIRRRRECLECNFRFTTFETIDLTLQVKKRDGTYEDFDPEKIKKGLLAACYRSRVSHDQVQQIVHSISTDLMRKQIREIDSKELGEIAMSYLQKLDTVAYIRFACVYRRFKDIYELMEALKPFPPRHGEQQKEV